MLKRIQIFKALEIEIKKHKGPSAVKHPYKDHKSLKEELSQTGVSIIGEISGGNPMHGRVRQSFRPSTHAKSLLENGATILSIATDAVVYAASDKHLPEVRGVAKCPLIRRDFIFEEYQIEESKILGADAIYLSAALLETERLVALQKLASLKNLDVVVEVSCEEDIEKALEAEAQIICVVGRDLNSWEPSWEDAVKLLKMISKKKCLKMAEAGINSLKQLKELATLGVHGAIIGDVLLPEFYPGKRLAQLLAGIEPPKKVVKKVTVAEAPKETKDAKEIKETKAAKDAKDAKDTKGIKDTKDAKVSKSAKESGDAKSGKSSKMDPKAIKSAKNIKDIGTKSTKTAKAAEPTKSAKPVSSVKDTKNAKSAKDAKAAKNTKPAKSAKPAKPTRPTTIAKPVKSAQTAKVVVDTKKAKAAKEIKVEKSTKGTKVANDTKSVKGTKGAVGKAIKPVKSTPSPFQRPSKGIKETSMALAKKTEKAATEPEKKTAAKKAAPAKKAVAAKPAAKPVAKKAAPKKAVAKTAKTTKPAAKKAAPAKKAVAAKKAAPKKAVAKTAKTTKPAVKKAAPKKAVAKTTKPAVKKAAPKKAVAKTTKPAVKKPVAKKATPKKAVAKTVVKKAAAPKKAAPKKAGCKPCRPCGAKKTTKK